jgi:hypothetical protein
VGSGALEPAEANEAFRLAPTGRKADGYIRETTPFAAYHVWGWVNNIGAKLITASLRDDQGTQLPTDVHWQQQGRPA